MDGSLVVLQHFDSLATDGYSPCSWTPLGSEPAEPSPASAVLASMQPAFQKKEENVRKLEKSHNVIRELFFSK